MTSEGSGGRQAGRTAAPRRRRVTAADVAREVGVSRAAVGFALNDTPGYKISEPMKAKIREAAERLGYRPNQAAQALARGRSNVVLVVLPDWPLDVHLRGHLEEAERALDDAGLTLVTYTRHSGARARPLWEILVPDVAIGLTPFTADEIARLRAAGVGRIIPGHPVELDKSPFVEIGPRLQIEHLRDRGHRKVAYAGSADARLAVLSEIRGRLARAVAEEIGLGLTASADVDLETPLGPVLRDWADAGITAVAAYNDEVAAMVLKAARGAGLRVPGDLAVIGHDDIPLARLVDPALSSVGFDAKGLGRYLADLALGVESVDEAVGIAPARPAVVRREST